MPLFSREVLQAMKVRELRALCKKYNIKSGKNKAGYVDNIALRSETMNKQLSEVETLYHHVQHNSLKDPAPPHKFYREHFNAVDLADRKWYAVEDHHHH